MKPEKAKGALASLKPIIFLSQISGITYFRGINKWIILYRILILLILGLCLMHEIPTVAFWIGGSKSLHAVLTAFETSLRWTLLFFNNMVTAFRNSKINQVLDNLNKLKLDVEESAWKRAYRFQIFMVCFNLFLISSFMVLGHHFIWYNINKRWYTSIIYIFTEYYIALGNMQFSAFAYLFGEYFKTFNQKFLSTGKSAINHGPLYLPNFEENYFAQQLKDLREKHLRLSYLTSELDNCYTIQVSAYIPKTREPHRNFVLFLQLLLFVLLSLVEIVYSLRAFFLHVVNKRSSDVWTTIPVLAFIHMVFWGSYYFFAVIQMVALCDRIVSEVCLDTYETQTIVKIMQNFINFFPLF